MNKYTTLFLIVSIILAFGWDWNIPSCILVICAAVLELLDVTPKLWRYYCESKKIRTERNLSVPQLAELSGISRRTIQDLEKRDDGRISTAIKLADALGVTLDQLCRDETAE